MRTLALPDGSVVKLVDIRRVRVESHFLSSKYYVDLDMRYSGVQEDLQHISKADAERRQADIVALMQEAWQEVDPYQCGLEEGAATGRSEGYDQGRSEGYNAGIEEGRSQGWGNGYREGKQSIISHLIERRENLMREQSYDDQSGPSRRRYRRNAIDILTEIIQCFLPRPDDNY